MPRWRPMRAADLPAVAAIAGLVHPAYPEDAAVLAERLALHPDACRILDDDGAPAGYLIAHPWHDLRPPPLNRLLGALPDPPGCLHLHDLALLPSARGTGAAAAAVTALLAASSLPVTLVAVGRSRSFWQRFGFITPGDSATAAMIAGYGADSTYMRLP